MNIWTLFLHLSWIYYKKIISEFYYLSHSEQYLMYYKYGKWCNLYYKKDADYDKYCIEK